MMDQSYAEFAWAQTCDLLAIDDHTAGLIYSDFTQLDSEGVPHKCMMWRTITVED